MTKYPRIQKVFLSGRINSTWQDKVIQSVPELVYFDPRTHNLNNPDQYASWDMHYVKEADILFGYMEKDNPSGYGLATEIGYARGLGKTIILVDERSRNDEQFSDFFAIVRASSTVVLETLNEGITLLKSFAKENSNP